ncbi:MAG: NAD-dependent epimerase/dehydratase family protein [Planctomycetota bacterium]
MNNFWKDRTVFITGSTGFVGAHIASALLDKGAHVVCLQRDAIHLNSLDLFKLRNRVDVIQGTIEDGTLMERIITEYEVDSVFHLAAQAIVGAANRSPLSTFESNIRGTYLLLEACRRSETVKRVVVASSDKAYGSHTNLPYTEEFPLHGLFPYDASKACTDILARSFAHTYGTPVVVTRFANIYGPGDTNFSRVVPGTIKAVLQNERPLIRSDGTPVREFVHVSDVARGYLLLAERISEVSGQAFNFGTGEVVQIQDLVRRIIRLAGKEKTLEPIIALETKIGREIDAQYLSVDKIHAKLGWRAEIPLEQGLAQTIEWYRSHLASS